MADIEKRIEEIKERAAKWGKLHEERVTGEELKAIIAHFEQKLEDCQGAFGEQERAFRRRVDEINQAHAKAQQELTGRIGGLQRKVNSLEKGK